MSNIFIIMTCVVNAESNNIQVHVNDLSNPNYALSGPDAYCEVTDIELDQMVMGADNYSTHMCIRVMN